MPSSPVPISVVIGGVTWVNWTRYELDADFVSPADAWSVEAANPTAAQIASLVTGASVQVLVGGVPVLTGLLERKAIRRSPDGTVISISGRDLAAPLVDCCPSPGWGATSLSLEGVAAAAITELGIVATLSVVPEAQVPRPHLRPEPGETWWALLDRLARKARLMVWMTPAGTLSIGRPDYLSPPVGALVFTPGARCNVKEGIYTEDLSGRFSAVTVVGQTAGSDFSGGGSVSGTAQDAELVARGLHRPTVVDDGEVASSAEARDRAAWEISHRAFASKTLQYTVVGHGPSEGVLWAPNQQVTVEDDIVAGGRGTWWISGRRLLRDAGGTRTVLTLHPPNLLLPAVA